MMGGVPRQQSPTTAAPNRLWCPMVGCNHHNDGYPITRIPDKDREYESGHRFLLGMEEVDLTMNKAAFRHHHFLTDLNVGEGESVLRLENYQKDGVHLNNKGVEAYKTVLTYVLDCMAFEVWRERKILPLPGSEKEFRTVMWKF